MRVGTRRLVLWIAIALVGVDFTYLSGASNFLASPQSRILNQVLVLGLMVAGAVAVRRGWLDLRSPLTIPGLAWIGATAAATLFSQRPAASLEGLALLLLAAPAYLVVRAILMESWLRQRVDWLLIVSTTVFAMAYLFQAFTQWLSWWSVAGPSIPPLRPGDVGLTIGTVNAVSLYLELLGPIAVWLSWTRWRSRPFTVLLALTALSALVITGSRGAWIGAMAGAAFLASVGWLDAGRPMPRPRGRGRRGPLAWLGGAVLVAAGLAISGPFVTTRMLSGDAGRLELWSAAWSMFAAHPITGVGTGAWQGLRALTPISSANYAVLATSHNSILQVLAETGIVGLLAAGWLVLGILSTGRRAIASAPDRAARITAWICLASLVAAAIHSLVDTQFHLPGVVLLIMLLVARLDLAACVPAGASTAGIRPSGWSLRARLTVAATAVVVGAVLLVPVDIAMVRAQLGNLALDRDDAATALDHFNAATGLHDLPVYRLGQALALGSLGDLSGAADSLAKADTAEPFTFVAAERAFASLSGGDRDLLLARIEADGPYDATATLTAALLRFETDRVQATSDLAAVMANVPTLVFSTRPPALFDDETWASAQHQAIQKVGVGDPVTAAAVATMAGLQDDAVAQRSSIPDGPERRALDLLDAASVGHADLEAARALLRLAPSSAGVQNTIWLLAFRAKSQPLIDEVSNLAVPLFFALPLPPMELVMDGRSDANYSERLPRYPMAASGRLGPRRPYLAGMVTIEPVYRPKS